MNDLHHHQGTLTGARRDIFPPYCTGCRHEEVVESRRTPPGGQFVVTRRFAQCLRGKLYGAGCRDYADSPKTVFGRNPTKVGAIPTEPASILTKEGEFPTGVSRK